MHKLTYTLVTLLLLTSVADAQSARIRIRQGSVSGVELAIDGATSAPRGGDIRWLVTAYDVLGLSDLRPAPGATVHVATSLAQTEERSFQTDAFGRAELVLPIPGDAPDGFLVVIRVVSAGDVQRRFELPVQVTPKEAIEVHVARTEVAPDGPLRVFGRLSVAASARPLASQAVQLTLRDAAGRPVDAPASVTTDEAGLFAHTFRVPDDVGGPVRVEARAGADDHPVRANAGAQVTEPSGPPLLVAVAPEAALVRPGQRVPLEVVVRSGNGRPIEGATVTLGGARREDPDRFARTDARGHAQLAWRAPAMSSGVRDVAVTVVASREGWGQASGAASIRVAADEHAAALAVEGGALSPELGGRVWIRVVGPDGRPAGAGVPVRMTGVRLAAGDLRGSTDEDGVATFDVDLPGAPDATRDRCGGETATAITYQVAGGAEASACLPLDPDAAARVRVAQPVVTSGGSLEVEVARVRGAARAPVALSVLNGPHAIAHALLAPNQRGAQIALPEDASGVLTVRARVLVGDTRVVARGGSTSVLVLPAEPATVDAELDPDGTTRLRFGGAAGTRSAYVVAASVDEARALAARLERGHPLGDLRRDLGSARAPLLLAALAARTTPDVAAPTVLRAGRPVAVPAPANPEQEGLLNDPWRTRARFVTGRLALIFRALEQYVAASIPERTEDVAVQGPRGFTFNGQILESVAESGSLGSAGATGLGGDPLTIEQLQRFDPQLSYDNVARRITRERLFRLLLALRFFVQQHGFDLPWSRLGDPSEWMRQLMGQPVPGVGAVSQQMLVDGWGRPFRLVPARGSSRFGFVDPLGSWELISAGPDGRYGSGDDFVDPTRRILRSGTPYAEAVGEDLLVARLEGMELGRASVELLQQVEPQARAGGVPSQSSAPAAQLAAQLWGSLPSVFEPPADPLALRRPAHPGDGAGGELVRLPATGGEVRLSFDEEPRTWGAVAVAFTDAGWGATDVASALAGSPLIVESPVTETLRLRAGEDVSLDVVVTNVTDRAQPVRLEASGRRLRADAPDELVLRAGEATTFSVSIAPERDPGRGALSLAFLGPDGAAVRSARWPTRVVTGDHPLRLRSAGLVRDRPWRLSLTVPSDARRASGRVVLLAPDALAADPDLADAREDDPALVAFSNALAGRRSDPALWSRLLRAQDPNGLVQGRLPLLSSAAAAVAWAGADPHDEDARAALSRIRVTMPRYASLPLPDPDAVRTASATLGALAAGGVPAVNGGGDPLAQLASQLQRGLRRTLRAHPEEPTLLARAAAALLLADPRDAYGRAMLERAAAHLRDTSDGGARVVPSERMDHAAESLAATLALAVAAHQVGDAALSARLLRGGLARDHVAQRAGGEALFWMLAAGSYGALGQGTRVAVTIDGSRRELDLEGGRAVLPLPTGAGGHRVVVEPLEGSAFVRVEAAMDRPFAPRQDGPFTLAVEGDPGDGSTLAALELSVTAREETDAAVLDLQLPAGVEATDALLASIGRGSSVASVEPREPGFLRLRLSPMAAGTTQTISLPLAFTVTGDLRGLGAIAYPLGRPGEMTVLPPRRL